MNVSLKHLVWSYHHFLSLTPALLRKVSLEKDVFIFPRASFKERGIKLIEEKVKPAFQKIHDYYLEVSKANPR